MWDKDFLATGKHVLCLGGGTVLEVGGTARDAYGYKTVVGMECMRNETSVVVKARS